MRVPFLSDQMDAINDLQQYADPRTRDWFLLFGSPVPVWILTALYLLIVIKLGPRYMKNRPAYSLQKFMVVYNISMVVVSLYMFIEITLSFRELEYGWFCAPYNKHTWKNPKELRMASVLWVFAITKAVEFMDTFLMILRKKFEQVTFLHVFHHTSMLNIYWWVPVFVPGGQSWFSASMNSLVHVVMYTYYGLAVIPALRKYLWWKKYITKFQLVQFFLIFGHTVQTFFTGCDYPLGFQILLFFYMLALIALFCNFYYRSYLEKKAVKVVRSKKTDSYANGHTEVNGLHSDKTIQNGSYIPNGHSTEATLRH